MSPLLLLPAGLAALAALALPLLLHLARRGQRTPVDFAALRWLAARVRPRRRLRFEEPLLLALRLVLIALLALLLARPAIRDDGPHAAWIVAAPGIDAGVLREATPDPATGAAAIERRWLAPGFPLLAEGAPSGEGAGLASLLRELDMRMPSGASLTVLVPPVLDGLDAERPRLSRPVDWRVVEGSGPGHEAGSVRRPGPPRLVFGQDDAASPYLRATARAWQSEARDAAVPGPEVRIGTGPSFSGPLRAWVEAGGTALLAHDVDSGTGSGAVLWADADGNPLLQASGLGRGRVLQWTRPLDPAVFPGLLEADFPHRLRDAIQPRPAPGRALAGGHAPVVAEVGPWPAVVRDARPWVALLVALLFLAERWIAAGPRAERSA